MTQQTISEFENLTADEIIECVLRENHGRACITCSFQTEGMVVLHMLRSHLPDIPVLFLDTGYHFADVYAYRDRMVRQWRLNLLNLRPADSVAEQEAKLGLLYRTDPASCCYRRKVEPLMAALDNFDIWFTGLRREQSPTRKNLRPVEQHQLPSGKTLLKVNPLAAWDYKQVLSHAAKHGIERLPLYDLGYRSIGCQPCTEVPREGCHERSGRWGGSKLECGIHTFSRLAERPEQR